MTKNIVLEKPVASVALDPGWPRDVALILSALEAGEGGDDRRITPRMIYNVKGALRLYSSSTQEKLLYTRDANARSLGFVTSHCLPLGYGGQLSILSPQGRQLRVACTVLRCRQTAPGWYEGVLNFNRDQSDFAVPENIEAFED